MFQGSGFLAPPPGRVAFRFTSLARPMGPHNGTNRRMYSNTTQTDKYTYVALHGSWDTLVVCKRLPEGGDNCSIPGEHISKK